MAATVFVPVLGDVSLVLAVISGLALFVSFVFVRQRYISVIGDIPGPFLGTFGTCFQLWEISRGRINQKLAQLHTEYGMTPPNSIVLLLMPPRAFRTHQLQRSQCQPPRSHTDPRSSTLEIGLVQTLRRTQHRL